MASCQWSGIDLCQSKMANLVEYLSKFDEPELFIEDDEYTTLRLHWTDLSRNQIHFKLIVIRYPSEYRFLFSTTKDIPPQIIGPNDPERISCKELPHEFIEYLRTDDHSFRNAYGMAEQLIRRVGYSVGNPQIDLFRRFLGESDSAKEFINQFYRPFTLDDLHKGDYSESYEDL